MRATGPGLPPRLLLVLLVLPCFGFEWPGRVHRLQYEMKHAEPQRRAEVARQLGQYTAPQVRKALLGGLEDDDARVRLEAAASAGRVGLREAIPILLDWLDDRSADTRRAAASALGRIGAAHGAASARVLGPLVRALGDSAASVRHAAVTAIARVGTGEAVTPLLGRLEDADLSIRLETIHALGKLGDARAVVPLLARVRDADADVRVATVTALGAIGDGRAAPSLVRALEDSVERVRFAAVSSLGRLRDRGSVGALEAAIAEPQPRLARAVLAALGQIGGERARRVLIDRLAEPALERAAVAALLVLVRDEVSTASGPGSGSGSDSESGSDSGSTGGAGTVAALVEKLASGIGPQAERAVAGALEQLAEAVSIDAAVDALLARLAASGDDVETGDALAFALAASGDGRVLMPLLERLGRADTAQLDPVLAALERHLERIEPDGRAADPLMARLEGATAAQQARIARLLGRVGAPRALAALRPLLENADDGVRLSAVRAMGELGSTEGAPALLSLIDARDGRTRFEAAQALRTTADAASVSVLLGRLEDPGQQPIDRHAFWTALGGALPRLEAAGQLEPRDRARALELLTKALGDRDRRLSDRAMDVLGSWATPEALPLVAAQLRSHSSRTRARAAAVIGGFDHPEARVVLRYVLRHGKSRVQTAAATALGEVGDRRDMDALLRLVARKHWPVPGAVAHALTRMVARGALKIHAARRALCQLGASREPYVRANVAAAMAHLGARSCRDAQAPAAPDPLAWLEPEHAPEVRAAAARWAHAAARDGRIDAARVAAALRECQARDLEASVRAACADPELPDETEGAQLYAYAPDGVTLLRDRLVGVQLADGSVHLGYTDRNGMLRLRRAPKGALRLLDPVQAPLEPLDVAHAGQRQGQDEVGAGGKVETKQ